MKHLVTWSMVLLMLPAVVVAQPEAKYPTRPVRMIVPAPPVPAVGNATVGARCSSVVKS